MPLHDFILSLDLTIRTLIAAAILIVLMALEHYLVHRKGKESARHIFFSHLAVLTIYFIGLGFALYITGMHRLFLGVEARQSLLAKLAQIAIVWISAIFLVHNFSGIFRKIDEVVESIDLSEHLHVVMEKSIRYLIYFTAALITLRILGLVSVITALLAGAGFAGIVVGFAAKDVLGNFFGGLTILADRPFEIGDYIEVVGEDIEGEVTEISMRSTEMISRNNTDIIIPNSMLANSSLMNYTRTSELRLSVDLGISYDADLDEAYEAIGDAVRSLDFITRREEIEVLVDSFGDSSIDLQVRFWADVTKESPPKIRGRCLKAIKESLDDAGIEIPYPTRTIIQKD